MATLRARKSTERADMAWFKNGRQRRQNSAHGGYKKAAGQVPSTSAQAAGRAHSQRDTNTKNGFCWPEVSWPCRCLERWQGDGFAQRELSRYAHLFLLGGTLFSWFLGHFSRLGPEIHAKKRNATLKLANSGASLAEQHTTVLNKARRKSVVKKRTAAPVKSGPRSPE